MAVTKPLRMVLTNWPVDKVELRKAPNFPKDTSKGFHEVPFSRVVFIEHSDFQPDNLDKNYFGLAVGKEVHLKYAYNVCATGYKTDADGNPIEVEAVVTDTDSKDLPKGKLCWVAEPAPGVTPIIAEFRLYSRLFKSPVPPKDYLSDLNPDSLVTVTGYVDPSLATAAQWDKFQLERLGYFNTDTDSTP